MTCPSPERLDALLQGRLSPEEQAGLGHHIDGCSTCQALLETTPMDGQSWVDVAPELVEAASASPVLQQVLQRAQEGSFMETTEGKKADAADASSYLQPSDKPGHLGRLGHYEVIEILGRGGFGTVFKAFDEKLHRVVAIKVLSPELAAKGNSRPRFIREAQKVAAVKNDHVIAIHVVDEDHEPPYFVMEYIDGISLQDRLDKEGLLDIREVLRIGLQIANGLAAAHAQGIIHRDIKPSNVLLENGVQRVKITDFGLARAVDDASITHSGFIAGTPMYMAPEQAAAEQVDHRADLFSLGSVLYTMCTGRPPFRASATMAVLKRVIEDTPRPIRATNPEVPEWLEAIIIKLHAKKSEERVQSAKEVADLLGQYLAELQQPGTTRVARSEQDAKGVETKQAASTPFEDSGRATRPWRRRRRWALATAVLALLGVGLGGYFWGRDLYLLTTNQGVLEFQWAPDLILTDAHVFAVRKGPPGHLPNEATLIDVRVQRTVTLPAGEYHLVTLEPASPLLEKVFPEKSKRKLQPEPTEVTIGRGERKAVTLAYKARQPDAKVAAGGPKTDGENLSPPQPPPPDPVKLAVFDPAKFKGELPGGMKLTVEEGGVARFELPLTLGAPQTVKVLEVAADKVPAGGELSCRATVKAKHFGRVWSGLLTFGQTRVHVLNDEWKAVELRTPAHEFWQADPVAPGAAPVLLGFDNQEIWIKDLEVWHIPGPPSEPREVKPGETVLKSFTYKDKPISSDYVNELEGGWRFEVPKANNGDSVIRLFQHRVTDWQAVVPKVAPGRLIVRAKIKTSKLGTTELWLWCRFPGGARDNAPRIPGVDGSTNWTTYEREYRIEPGRIPEVIEFEIGSYGGGTLWIKDVDFLHAPAETKANPGEVVLKRIDLKKDSPVTATSINSLDHEIYKWLSGGLTKDEWGFFSETKQRTVVLHRVEKPEVDGARLTLRARLLSGTTWVGGELNGAYLQIVCHFAGGGAITSPKPALLLQGQSNWALHHASLSLPKGMKVELVEMNLIILPSDIPREGTAGAQSYVGLKDIALVKSPATGPPQPVLLRSFDPAKDKLLHVGPKVEEGGWRIDHEGTSTHVPLFRVADVPVPKTGSFILRAKLKAQKAPHPSITVGASLRMTQVGSSRGNPGFENVTSIDWAGYEARYSVEAFHDLGAYGIPLDLMVFRDGTTWIKDIELLWLPEPVEETKKETATPSPAPPAPAPFPKIPGETVLERIDTLTKKPLTLNRFTHDPKVGWKYHSHSDDDVSMGLFDAHNPDVNGQRLTVRAHMLGEAQMGPEGANGAYLMLVVHYAGGAKLVSPKPAVRLEGVTNWAVHSASLTLPKWDKPERVQAILVVPHTPPSVTTRPGSQVVQFRHYSVLIKDIELVKSPAAGPPQPVVMRTFDPAKDKLLPKSKVEDGGWRIESNLIGKKQVQLFRVTDVSVPRDGQFILRAKMKGATSDDSRYNISAQLAMGADPPKKPPASGFSDVTTIDWATYEAVYPVSKFQNVGATGIPLDLVITSPGTTWIKDIELLWLPEAAPMEANKESATPPAATEPAKIPGEVRLKRIDPKDTPITTGGFSDHKTKNQPWGLKFPEGDWAFESETKERTVRLHELYNPIVEGDQLTLRARMRCFETWYAQGNRNSAPASGAYLQITCSFPSGAILTSQKPAPILEGYTHWALYHAKVTVPKGWKPERVQMNLVLPPHNEPLGPALVGLKDIELVKSPATGPPQPVLSRRFDPAKDKLLHGKAKVQDGGWRIDHEGRKNKTGAQDGNIPERVRLFQVTDVTIPKGGPFILRAKLKAQGSPPTVGASLSMGPEPAKSAINDGFREVSSNDWAIYETSYPVSKFHNVTAIPLDLLLYGLGTTWIKDVELLYLPDAGGGKNVAEV